MESQNLLLRKWSAPNSFYVKSIAQKSSLLTARVPPNVLAMKKVYNFQKKFVEEEWDYLKGVEIIEYEFLEWIVSLENNFKALSLELKSKKLFWKHLKRRSYRTIITG